MAISQFLVKNTSWASPSPLGILRWVGIVGSPGEDQGRAPGPGCWLGENGVPLRSTPFWLPAFQERLEGGPPCEPAPWSQSHLGRGGLVHLGPAGFWSPSGLGQLAWPLLARLLAFLVSGNLGPGWGPLEDWVVSLWFFQQRVLWLPLLMREAPEAEGSGVKNPGRPCRAPLDLPGPPSLGAQQQLLPCLLLLGTWPPALLPRPEPTAQGSSVA